MSKIPFEVTVKYTCPDMVTYQDLVDKYEGSVIKAFQAVCKELQTASVEDLSISRSILEVAIPEPVESIADPKHIVTASMQLYPPTATHTFDAFKYTLEQRILENGATLSEDEYKVARKNYFEELPTVDSTDAPGLDYLAKQVNSLCRKGYGERNILFVVVNPEVYKAIRESRRSKLATKYCLAYRPKKAGKARPVMLTWDQSVQTNKARVIYSGGLSNTVDLTVEHGCNVVQVSSANAAEEVALAKKHGVLNQDQVPTLGKHIVDALKDLQKKEGPTMRATNPGHAPNPETGLIRMIGRKHPAGGIVPVDALLAAQKRNLIDTWNPITEGFLMSVMPPNLVFESLEDVSDEAIIKGLDEVINRVPVVYNESACILVSKDLYKRTGKVLAKALASLVSTEVRGPNFDPSTRVTGSYLKYKGFKIEVKEAINSTQIWCKYDRSTAEYTGYHTHIIYDLSTESIVDEINTATSYREVDKDPSTEAKEAKLYGPEAVVPLDSRLTPDREGAEMID